MYGEPSTGTMGFPRDITMVGPGKLAWLGLLAGAAGDTSAQVDQGGEHSYGIEAAYTADIWRNARGGLRTGNAYLDRFDLVLSVDGERAWGMRGVSARAQVIYKNGSSFSQRYVGDEMTVSNMDVPGGLRLYEAWIQWSLDSRRPSLLRFGLFDLNAEFDTNGSRSLFIHSTHGMGHEFAQTGMNGPSTYPLTSLGLRVSWEPATNWRVLAAVMDGSPGDPQRISGADIGLSSEEGALGVAEVQWSSGRVRKLSLGHWHYTANFDDLRSTEATPLPKRGDNSGSYAALEMALGSSDSWRESATYLFARYGIANGDINVCDEFYSFGFRYRGPMASRPEDELGLAISRANVGWGARKAFGDRRDSHETAIELTYRVAFNGWIAIQPDVQYIVNPGMNQLRRNSLVFGMRFEFASAVFR